MLRLAALGISHEANTFSAIPVDLATIQQSGLLVGERIRAEHADAGTTMAGYLAAGQAPDVEVVPLVMTTLVPSGRITAEALRTVADTLTAALSEHGPFDGVLAALHGAAVADGCHDVDGYLLRRFREVVGPGVPIGVALDLHANISDEMIGQSDVLNTYRTNPHVDAKERAREIAEIVIRTARGQVRPTTAFQPLPAVINILCQNTGTAPMADVLADLRTVLAEPGVLTATVAEGYPYADVPEMGMSVVVVTDGDPVAADRHARWLASRVWARRELFDTTRLSPVDALRRASEAARGPVLLLDVGDNIGGGSPGDSVVLLAAARQLGVASLLTIIADPDAVRACVSAGVGGHAALRIGAKTDPRTGPPVEATATVLALHDGRYEDAGPTHSGARYFDAGPSAAVRLDSGQTVVLTSRVTLPLTPVQVTSLGLDLASFQAVVAKGVHSPLAGYGPHVAEVLQVDTPGVTGADLGQFTYHHRRRPLFPFEPDAAYPEGVS
ncbi:M81 family metallopeptidase [Phytohabitans kaempferiae]|uniref:M81 family metallopeptidase n=1 Tax=Phytohabitans kaempferiae TaxID=1620943 RepID=A0ABV6M6I8_9ACTN